MLDRALQRLPEKPRTALVLKRVEACSIPQIATQMRVSESSVKRWLAKAEARLARELNRTGIA